MDLRHIRGLDRGFIMAKRGRPKGSKNKIKTKIKTKVKTKVKINKVKTPKKRGRPIGSKNKVKTKEKRSYSKQARNEDLINVITYSFLGYCPRCEIMIGNTDLEEGKKTVIICPSCHTRNKMNKLLVTKKTQRDKPKSKKEFLSDIVAVTYDHEEVSYVKKVDIPHELKTYHSEDSEKIS